MIFPNRKIIVFGDRRGFRFADNSRYLFLLLQKDINYRCIWLTKSESILDELKKKKLECYKADSLKGVYYSLKARWHIFNHSSRDTSENFSLFRNKLNLWHSTPIKKQTTFKNVNKIYEILYRLKNFFSKEYLLLTDEILCNNLSKHFPKYKYKTFISSLPKNIMLSNEYKDLDFFRTDYEKSILKKISLQKKKIIGYFPTYRKTSKDMFIDFENEQELLDLNKILVKNKTIIVFKLHQNSFREDKSESFNIENEKFNSFISELSNFIGLDYECDVNSILSNCDLIVSDYSGIVLDYLYVNKPIIFYCPDLDEYKKTPGLALDIEKQDFAYLAKNKHEFFEFLNQYFEDKDKFEGFHGTQRNNMLNNFFPKENNFKEIKKILNN